MARSVLANRMLLSSKNDKKSTDDDINSVELKELQVQKDPTFIEQQLKEFSPDGSTELIIRVLGGLCSGQFAPLQLYLRFQEDNLRKVNIVQEITLFLGGIYSHIDKESIQLVTQTINCLKELCLGNHENRSVSL